MQLLTAAVRGLPRSLLALYQGKPEISACLPPSKKMVLFQDYTTLF